METSIHTPAERLDNTSKWDELIRCLDTEYFYTFKCLRGKKSSTSVTGLFKYRAVPFLNLIKENQLYLAKNQATNVAHFLNVLQIYVQQNCMNYKTIKITWAEDT